MVQRGHGTAGCWTRVPPPEAVTLCGNHTPCFPVSVAFQVTSPLPRSTGWNPHVTSRLQAGLLCRVSWDSGVLGVGAWGLINQHEHPSSAASQGLWRGETHVFPSLCSVQLCSTCCVQGTVQDTVRETAGCSPDPRPWPARGGGHAAHTGG